MTVNNPLISLLFNSTSLSEGIWVPKTEVLKINFVWKSLHFVKNKEVLRFQTR